MQAFVLTISNPFDPLSSRQMEVIDGPKSVRDLAPETQAPYIAVLNGSPILRADWGRVLCDSDQLAFVLLPQGGGGRGGSNPLKVILSLALTAFAPWAAGALLGKAAETVLFGSFTLGKAVGLGITLAGSAAINALFPASQGGGQQSASPTYSLTAQGNVARLEQAIPVQYGRLLAYPDFAATPYTEYQGGEQYLYQLLCLGAGEYEVEEIRIEDTPISAFTEVEAEVVGPNTQVTLFPANVVTSVEVSGQDLPPTVTGTWSRTGTTVTVTQTGHGRAVGQAVNLTFTTGSGPNGTYAIATVPTANTFTVTTATGTGSGNVTIASVLGGLNGFTVAPAETVTNKIGVDLILPSGLYVEDGADIDPGTVVVKFEATPIDAAGTPTGAAILLAEETITDGTTSPLRKSFLYTLTTPGRYAVRAYRLDAGVSDAVDVLFAAMRAYLPETATYGDVTMIAMRMRASNNLSLQASRRIAVLATRKLPIWNGTAWSAPTKTRSIAWAIADAARNTEHGAALPDARLDLPALLALDAIWAARGDEFNGRFDSAATWWEQATKITAAGRARLFMQGGKLRIVRDGLETVPVALFSMRNIIRGSFSQEYVMPTSETAKAISVAYLDETSWKPQRVVAALPGADTSKPLKVEKFGITRREQALREGMYDAAANRYRRRIVRFSTEMEGFIPSIGDLIAIQHDSPGYGAHGEALAWDAATRTLRVSEPMVVGDGAWYVGLRRLNGSVSGPWRVIQGATENHLVLVDTPDFTPVVTGDVERTHVVFGQGDGWAAKAKVIRTVPRGMTEIQIEAAIDDPSVHTADQGVIAPPVRVSSLPSLPTLPVVTGLIARSIPGATDRMQFAWAPAPGATVYHLEMAPGSNPDEPNLTWTRIGDTTASDYVATLMFSNRTVVRVRGIGLAAGPWVSASVGSLMPFMWNPSPATAMWTTDSNLMWSA